MKINTTIKTETQHNKTLIRNEVKARGLKVKTQVKAGYKNLVNPV